MDDDRYYPMVLCHLYANEESFYLNLQVDQIVEQVFLFRLVDHIHLLDQDVYHQILELYIEVHFVIVWFWNQFVELDEVLEWQEEYWLRLEL